MRERIVRRLALWIFRTILGRVRMGDDAVPGENDAYFCWCGKVHRGEYAIYDWFHHHCLHAHLHIMVPLNEPARAILPGEEIDIICENCGNTFSVSMSDWGLDNPTAPDSGADRAEAPAAPEAP